MPQIDYYDYIESDEWKEKSDAAKQRAGYRCQVCNASDQEIVLHTHHRTYERLGAERDDDLTVLCAECHDIYHSHNQIPQPPPPRREPPSEEFQIEHLRLRLELKEVLLHIRNLADEQEAAIDNGDYDLARKLANDVDVLGERRKDIEYQRDAMSRKLPGGVVAIF